MKWKDHNECARCKWILKYQITHSCSFYLVRKRIKSTQGSKKLEKRRFYCWSRLNDEQVQVVKMQFIMAALRRSHKVFLNLFIIDWNTMLLQRSVFNEWISTAHLSKWKTNTTYKAFRLKNFSSQKYDHRWTNRKAITMSELLRQFYAWKCAFTCNSMEN